MYIKRFLPTKWAIYAIFFVLLGILFFSPMDPNARSVYAATDQFSCMGVTQIPQSECEALVEIYDDTVGSSWTNSAGWSNTHTPCTWYGVTCDSSGSMFTVSRLDLSNEPNGNGLEGDIPSTIGNLTNLSYLNLSNNRLENLPTTINQLTRLEHLNLLGNPLGHNLPVELWDLTSLKSLTLYSTGLVTLSPGIGNLTNLESLNISNNPLGSVPNELWNLTEMRDLSLWNTQLTSLSSDIGKLTKLIHLFIHLNELSSLPPTIGNLTELRKVELSRNRLSSLPPEIGNLTKLTHLYLHSNQLSSLPDDITKLVNLTESFLTYNRLVIDPSNPVYSFVTALDPDWKETQTVAPTDICTTAIGPNSVRLTWTPILFQDHGGYYEISVSDGISYMVDGTTMNKSDSSYDINGLVSGTTYTFRIRTYTPYHNGESSLQHDNFTEEIWSEYSMDVAAPPGGACVILLSDLGDAPDSTNHMNVSMNAYQNLPPYVAQVATDSNFPTVYDVNLPGAPGPIHWQAYEKVWLGDSVSAEYDADLLPDQDIVTNLKPFNDTADLDEFDDGVLLDTLSFPACEQTDFEYIVNSNVTDTFYVNVWFDFDRDSDWDNLGYNPIILCPQGTPPILDWAVQDQVISVVPGENRIKTPKFRVGSQPSLASPMWMRITVSEQPAPQVAFSSGLSADGRGPLGGYQWGETEDYIINNHGRCVDGQGNPLCDLGDAPTRDNRDFVDMSAYPGTLARYPTVYDTDPINIGPIHWHPKEQAWLGTDVTLENDADLLPDEDTITNINPTSDTADWDESDDSINIDRLNLPECGQTAFEYTVTSKVTGTFYVNVWFDFDRDGDWNGPLSNNFISVCPSSSGLGISAPEWAIQDQVISVVPGTTTYQTPLFEAMDSPSPTEPMWMRITLSEQQAPLPVISTNPSVAEGHGPRLGYEFGETEDYYLTKPPGESRICGMKWEDDGDGIKQPSERGVPGWIINLGLQDGTIVASTTTDNDGNFCFVGLDPNVIYRISEDLPCNWTQTYPVSVTPFVEYHDVQIGPGETRFVNFGNQPGPPCIIAVSATPTEMPVQPGTPSAMPSSTPVSSFSPTPSATPTPMPLSTVEPSSSPTLTSAPFSTPASTPSPIPTLQAEPGDVGCDGNVDSVDALFILQNKIGLREGTDQCPVARQERMVYLPACDVSGDGECNAVDALFILRCEVGYTNVFCPAATVFENESAVDSRTVEEVAAQLNSAILRLKRPKQINIGETFTVFVEAESEAEMGAVTASVGFDRTQFEYGSCQTVSGNGITSAGCNLGSKEGEDNRILFNAVIPDGASGAFTLAEITFTHTGTAMHTDGINLKKHAFTDLEGIKFDVTIFGNSHRLYLPTILR